MASNPFRFGAVTDGKQLIGREHECEEILRSFRENRNLALVAPRGMGKTALMLSVLEQARAEGMQSIYVDLFPAINSRRFAEIYATALTLEPGNTVESMQEAVQQLVPSFMPRVTISGTGRPGLQLDLWDRERDIRLLLERILDAPAQMAEAAGSEHPLVVIFDDFEDLMDIGEDELLHSLSQAVRRHGRVCYAFIIRKDSTARNCFNRSSSPFYRLAEPVALDPVPDQAMVLGLEKLFRQAGLAIELDLLFSLIEYADRAPHYIQLLSYALFEVSRDRGVASEEDLRTALGHVLGVGAYSYKNQWDQLAAHQRNLVLAIAQGYTEKLHSQRMVFQLGLGSPSTVSKNLRTLMDREILLRRERRVHFVDPFFGLWLQRRMT